MSDFDLKEHLDLQRRHVLLNEKLRVTEEQNQRLRESSKLNRALVAEEKLRVAVEALELTQQEARSAITQRHMLGEVDSTFDFVVSKLELNCIKVLSKIKGGSDE